MRLYGIFLVLVLGSGFIEPAPSLEWTPEMHRQFQEFIDREGYRPQYRVPHSNFSPRYQGWCPAPLEKV